MKKIDVKFEEEEKMDVERALEEGTSPDEVFESVVSTGVYRLDIEPGAVFVLECDPELYRSAS